MFASDMNAILLTGRRSGRVRGRGGSGSICGSRLRNCGGSPVGSGLGTSSAALLLLLALEESLDLVHCVESCWIKRVELEGEG